MVLPSSNRTVAFTRLDLTRTRFLFVAPGCCALTVSHASWTLFAGQVRLPEDLRDLPRYLALAERTVLGQMVRGQGIGIRLPLAAERYAQDYLSSLIVFSVVLPRSLTLTRRALFPSDIDTSAGGRSCLSAW